MKQAEVPSEDCSAQSGPLEDWGVAVDVGNSNVRLAVFGAPANSRGLPTLRLVKTVPAEHTARDVLAGLPNSLSRLPWFFSNVNPGCAQRWTAALEQSHMASRVVPLSSSDFPLKLAVTQPTRVGVDRLAAATAAWALHGHPAEAIIVVDSGTAVTVDTVQGDGTFLGGAILAGHRLLSEALHAKTQQLPQVWLPENPQGILAIGVNTETAIQAGLYWGVIGAIRTLIERSQVEVLRPCRVIVTGGAGWWLVEHIPCDLGYDPLLVLRGIAYSAARGRHQET